MVDGVEKADLMISAFFTVLEFVMHLKSN